MLVAATPVTVVVLPVVAVRFPAIHMLVPTVVGILLIISLRHILGVPAVVIAGINPTADGQTGQSYHGVAHPKSSRVGRHIGHSVGVRDVDSVAVGVMYRAAEMVREGGQNRQVQKYLKI